jgi:hypothetical protein
MSSKMHSKVLAAALSRLRKGKNAKGFGKVSVAALAAVIPETRKVQGIMWELRQKGYEIDMVRDGRVAAFYQLKSVPVVEEAALAETATTEATEPASDVASVTETAAEAALLIGHMPESAEQLAA